MDRCREGYLDRRIDIDSAGRVNKGGGAFRRGGGVRWIL